MDCRLELYCRRITSGRFRATFDRFRIAFGSFPGNFRAMIFPSNLLANRARQQSVDCDQGFSAITRHELSRTYNSRLRYRLLTVNWRNKSPMRFVTMSGLCRSQKYPESVQERRTSYTSRVTLGSRWPCPSLQSALNSSDIGCYTASLALPCAYAYAISSCLPYPHLVTNGSCPGILEHYIRVRIADNSTCPESNTSCPA